MDVIINDKQYKGIQIGAVGTLPELRNQGLSRRLMELLIDKYSSEVDLFFLFANDSVMDFYPKFGFQKIDEYIYTSELTNSGTDYAARKLNMDNKEDYNLIIDFVQNRQPITKILGADNYGYITMWHLLNHHRENIFYLAEEDVIIIEEEKDSTIHIFELFNKMPIELETLLPRITSSERIAEAKFYFPPDQLKYEYETSVKEETGLFVLSSVEIGNDPFRFPTTAKT
jgi:hypothetical protein